MQQTFNFPNVPDILLLRRKFRKLPSLTSNCLKLPVLASRNLTDGLGCGHAQMSLKSMLSRNRASTDLKIPDRSRKANQIRPETPTKNQKKAVIKGCWVTGIKAFNTFPDQQALA
jgi:hypothetical protein